MHTTLSAPFRLPIFTCLLLCILIPTSPLLAEEALPEISKRAIGEGTLVWRFLPDNKDREQYASLWIHRDTLSPRGLLIVVDGLLGIPQKQLQVFARENHFAILGIRIQEQDLARILEDSLAKISAELQLLGLAHVPWVISGQASNAETAFSIIRSYPSAEQRVLCLLLGDYPEGLRIALNSKISPDQQVLEHIPVFNLLSNQMTKPTGREWANTHYPAIASQFVPYAMALGEMASPSSEAVNALLLSFIQDVYRHRVPESHDFLKGPAVLKPFRYEDGVLAGPYHWQNPPVGKTRPATRDEIGAIWLPSDAFAQHWFAFHNSEIPPSTRAESPQVESKASSTEELEFLYTGLAPAEEKILEKLIQPESLDTSEWTLRYSEDFEGKPNPDWYNYFEGDPSVVRRNPTKRETSLVQTNGVLELSGTQQAFAMLRYDWPEDVAVEYKARSLINEPCDLSVVLHGAASGPKSPWVNGIVYQFGGYLNTRSFFSIPGSRKVSGKEADDGARIRVGEWHHVRVEKRKASLRVWVDGEEREKSAKAISTQDQARLLGRKIGFYTYGGRSAFDDVKIYTLASKDISGDPPTEEELRSLVRALLTRAQSPASRQHQAALRFLSRYIETFAPTLRPLIEEASPQVSEELRSRLLKNLHNLPPRL